MKKTYLLLIFNAALFTLHNHSLSMDVDNPGQDPQLELSAQLTELEKRQARIYGKLIQLEQAPNKRETEFVEEVRALKAETFKIQQQIRNLHG